MSELEKTENIELIKTQHQEIFGAEPEIIIHAPGRINLIGEHTDYSEGYVMPVAIKMGINVAISKNEAEVLSVYSMDYQKKVVALYSNLNRSSQAEWFNYPLGVVNVLLKRGFKLPGLRITFTGNVPQGAGLSSSAALEVGVAYGIQLLLGLQIEGPELAKICQQAEHEVVGVKCGIMDQYISRMAEANKAMLIDTRTLGFRLTPLDLKTAKIVITNSNVPHKLSSSQYNQRVSECEEAVKIMGGEAYKTYLRDFSMDDFEKNRDLLPTTIRKRAYHVISENLRVLDAEKALKEGDLIKFGELMNQSHQSLSMNYEVSSPELDWLAKAAQETEGCYGARMTGGGFGGCTIALIEEASIPKYLEKLPQYKEKFGYTAVTYNSNAMPGAHQIWKK